MLEETTCPRCGAKRPANSPAGFCPQCLLRLGLETDPPNAASASDETGFFIQPPSDGDRDFVKMPSRSASPSMVSGILSSLDASIGPLPRILLRDGPAEEIRPIRPGSKEMPELTGDRGRYQLLGEIARGGMGAVLKGRDVDLGRDLAVKVILEEHLDHPEILRRFVEEAQIGGQLQHPGIVPVHELGQFPDGRLYIAMKLVKGRTLAVLLESRKDLTDDRSRFLSIFEQVCQTMAYAHARGVVHRDLKPSNVMVGSFGEVQVMDWGLAKVLDQGGVADEEKARKSQLDRSAVRTARSGSGAESRAGSVLGTPAYMAPEQARGALDTVDERADVFGLGSILCEILTGYPAYKGANSAELYRKAERADLADAFERLDACGAAGDLNALAKSCLATAAKDRPRDAGVVLARLTDHLAGVEERLRAAGLAQAKAEARAAAEHKHRILTLALAASVFATALLAGAGWVWVTSDRRAREARIANDRRAREALTASAIITALEDANHKLGQAVVAGRSSEKWVAALEAARRAETLLARGEGGAGLSGRVQAVLSEIARKRDEAEVVGKDRRMVERLAEIHNDLAVHEDVAKTDAQFSEAFKHYGVDVDALAAEEAGARLSKSPVAAELANALDQWAFLRRTPDLQDLAGARRLIAIAKVADPDPWRNELRDSLDAPPEDWNRTRESLQQLASSADAETLPEASVTRLAWALARHEQGETAISLLRRSQRAHPTDFWLNFDLANQLWRKGQLDEAIRFYSVSVAIRPQSAIALHGLGVALREQGRLEDAAATLRQAIQLHPDNARGHIKLGTVLLDLGEVAQANDEFRTAKRLQPDDGWVRCDIAVTLMARGQWNAAIDEMNEDLRRKPRNAPALDMLGMALSGAGRLDEAIDAFRQAIRFDPHFSPAQSNLGRALLANGEYQAAVDSVRRNRSGDFKGAHRGAFKDSHRGSPSQRLLLKAEHLIALEPRLSDLLKGTYKPKDAVECAEFARLCRTRRLFAASCRLWNEAISALPDSAGDLKADSRYEAACCAAQAACSPLQDEPSTEAIIPERCRKLALDWLKAALESYTKLLERGTLQDRAVLPKRLGQWQIDPALAGLRDQTALAALPEPERRDWQALWAEVETLRKRILRAGLPAGRGPPF
jgi:serine/threonine-protein kinase